MARWAGMCVLAVLAGCGGGGGGGGGGGPAPLAEALRVSNVAPARVDLNATQSSNPLVGFEVTADVTGDLSRLNGETVFVLIEDPRGLFELSSTFISPTGQGNRVTLRLKSTLALSGAVEGSLRINVCLDAGCTRPLGQSPVSVPYRLNVFPGLAIAGSEPVLFEIPFGEPSRYGAGFRHPVQLAAPANLGGLQVFPPFEQDWVLASGAAGGDVLATLLSDPLVPGQTVQGALSFNRRPVGTYVSYLKLTSRIDPLGRAETLREVRYTVRASGVDLVFDASQSSFDGSAAQQFVSVTSADGALYDRVSRIVYTPSSVTVPWLQVVPAANQPVARSRVFEVAVNRCQIGVSCLPAGSYSAEVYFATASGSESRTAWRVTLQAP